jgi:hypothetical protein
MIFILFAFFFLIYLPYLYLYLKKKKKKTIQFAQKIERASDDTRSACEEASCVQRGLVYNKQLITKLI